MRYLKLLTCRFAFATNIYNSHTLTQKSIKSFFLKSKIFNVLGNHCFTVIESICHYALFLLYCHIIKFKYYSQCLCTIHTILILSFAHIVIISFTHVLINCTYICDVCTIQTKPEHQFGLSSSSEHTEKLIALPGHFSLNYIDFF